jgi:hypothetical protein
VGVVLAVVFLLAAVILRRQSRQARKILARARSEISALLEEVQAFYVLEFSQGDVSVLPAFPPLSVEQMTVLDELGSGRYGAVFKVCRV